MYSKGFLGVQSDHKNGTFDYLHQFLIFSLYLNMKSRHFFHRISKHDSKYLKSEKLKKQLLWAYWHFFINKANLNHLEQLYFFFHLLIIWNNASESKSQVQFLNNWLDTENLFRKKTNSRQCQLIEIQVKKWYQYADILY